MCFLEGRNYSCYLKRGYLILMFWGFKLFCCVIFLSECSIEDIYLFVLYGDGNCWLLGIGVSRYLGFRGRWIFSFISVSNESIILV